jgi:16S rRNA processing protein RimM
MQKEDCIYIGQVARLHGFKGEVSLFLDVTDSSEYLESSMFVLDIDSCLTPFFIEAAAKRLLKKNIYIPETSLPDLGEDSFYDHEVIGFQVLDMKKGNIGIIIEVIDHAANPLLKIDFNGLEILIPIFDGLIHRVRREDNILEIKAPEGLIDLYIN